MTTERNGEARVHAETGPGGGPAAGAPPRTLAEELRTRPDTELAWLLRARPDLLSPVPNDVTQLATRAGTRASVVRALERLDRFALQTAEALAIAPDPCPYDTLLALLTGDDEAPDVAEALPSAVGTLRGQAIVWGGADRLRLVRTAREILTPSASGASPTGLGPTVTEAAAGMSPGRLQDVLAGAGLPTTHDSVTAVEALTALFTDRERMAALLDEAPAEALATLGRLVWGPPYGTVPAQPAAPVRWLLARGLLLPTAPGTVVLPREVALHLRGGRAHRVVEPVAPPVRAAAGHSPAVVDATAAGQAFTALGTVEDLLREWETGGPSVLRAGGLSVRDLKRTAAALDTDERTAAFWLELAYAAGLLASDGEAEERFAATPAYDNWLRLPAAERWAALVTAWLPATRTPGVVGGQDAKGRAMAVLGPGLDRSPAPEIRHRTLALLAALPPGTAPDPATLLARLRWQRGAAAVPGAAGAASGTGTGEGAWGADRRHAAGAAAPVLPPGEELRTRLTEWTLAEAELLGVTGRGALSAHGRALLGLPPAGSTERAGSGGGAAAGRERAGSGGPAQAPGHGLPPEHGAPAAGPASGHPEDTGFGAGSGTGTVPGRPESGTGTGHPEDTGTEHPASGSRTEPESGSPASAPGTGQPDSAVPGDPGSPDAGFPARSEDEIAAAAAQAATLLAPLLPEPLDHVLLQADLTAVAPGPLERPLAEALGVLADVESKGGATVYRFTPGSVRRALDAGRTAADLHAFLAEHSRTPVPQPLSYLVDDVARRHGHLRVGAASSYVRCDDDGLLAEIVADKRSAGLRLRRLAPTVLAAQADPATLLERLREMGYAPAAESAEGDVLITRADAHRTPPRTPPAPVPEGPPLPDATLLGAAVRAIRAGDRAATAGAAAQRGPASGPTAPGEGRLPRTTAAETLATVQAAAMTGGTVWIGYVNADGAASQRVLAPVRVEGGFVTGYDHTADEVRTYPLHRITGVAELADDTV
ncbi:helicase-associated domain-containing protein [Streptomyces sp. NPDC048845]|uniref:helicase-associated domain-containing protein n=1 Tax=Streptomyces sp. NPDC048845 TaxID=3155390 RepID=UPI0034462E45